MKQARESRGIPALLLEGKEFRSVGAAAGGRPILGPQPNTATARCWRILAGGTRFFCESADGTSVEAAAEHRMPAFELPGSAGTRQPDSTVGSGGRCRARLSLRR